MSEKQLRMIRQNLDDLPEVDLSEGYMLRTYQPGDEEAWAGLTHHGLGNRTADQCREYLTGLPKFLPDGLFFTIHEGRPVGTACAWRGAENEWNRGILHMVCVDPEHRGKNLGYMVSLAVLHFFRDRGFRDCILGTDDFRIQAIKSYLRLGFEPYYYDDSHRERWQAVLDQIRAR